MTAEIYKIKNGRIFKWNPQEEFTLIPCRDRAVDSFFPSLKEVVKYEKLLKIWDGYDKNHPV